MSGFGVAQRGGVAHLMVHYVRVAFDQSSAVDSCEWGLTLAIQPRIQPSYLDMHVEGNNEIDVYGAMEKIWGVLL